MYGWRGHDVAAAALHIEAGTKRVRAARHVRTFKKIVAPAASAVRAQRQRKLAVTALQIGEGAISTVPRIDVDDNDAAAGRDANVRVRPRFPPPFHLLGVLARIEKAAGHELAYGMFAGRLARERSACANETGGVRRGQCCPNRENPKVF